ncbi:type IV secretion system protein [Agrobacterium tumefaciens]|nr:type IV secretion system protein [Agrobacterium tumefaciens]
MSVATNMALVHPVAAQDAVDPAPDPAIGPVPAASQNAQETHDENSIKQLMKVVELSRLFAGGITQLFSAAQGQKQLLDVIRGAQIGPKAFPLLNGPEEIEGRKGGDGITEMTEGALNGAAQGPSDLVKALNDFREKFKLDKAFALKDDELASKKMLAQLAARGAVAGSGAEEAYKRANSSNDRLNEYITALQASADLKTSVDINTRVLIELTQQTNESVRTQSAITSLVGTYFMVLASEASEKDWIDSLKNFNR